MLILYLMFLAIMSLTALVLYAADKAKAKRGAWRIKEAVLLGVGFSAVRSAHCLP